MSTQTLCCHGAPPRVLTPETGDLRLATSSPNPAEPGLAAMLRNATKTLHVTAERSGVIANVLRGTANRHAYATFLRNLLPAYLALEQGLERHRDEPGVRLFARPETYRAAYLVADLHGLAGLDWETTLTLLPEGVTYAEAVADAGRGDGTRLIAHAYARYLGDLSGGQIMQRLLAKSLGLGPDSLAFYRFPAIADIAAFKTEYHQSLDAAGEEIINPDRITAEAEYAFRLNIDLSEAVAALH